MANSYELCEQRKLIKQYSLKPTRVEVVSPYGNYTKFQLDMRRKVEILKYNANKSSNQTNNLTKKEKFALLVRGGLSRTQAVTQSNIIDCSADHLIATPTTSSGVPGPKIYLYEDKNVPLYKYSDFNVLTYPLNLPSNDSPWQLVVMPDTLVFDNGNSLVYYLIINKSIDKPVHYYNLFMPFGFSVAGNIPPSYSPPLTFSGNVTLSLTDVALSVYYNNNFVKIVPSSNLTTDMSMVFNIPTSNSSANSLAFSATYFFGNLLFEFDLFTASTYVYSFIITANLTVTPNDTGVINYIALISNMSNSSSSNGCNLISPKSSTVDFKAYISAKK